MESINSISNISQLLGDKFMERFKLFPEQTLFPIDWNVLKQKRCPLCMNLLKYPRNRKIAVCAGNKHRKSFVIGLSKLNSLK